MTEQDYAKRLILHSLTPPSQHLHYHNYYVRTRSAREHKLQSTRWVYSNIIVKRVFLFTSQHDI